MCFYILSIPSNPVYQVIGTQVMHHLEYVSDQQNTAFTCKKAKAIERSTRLYRLSKAKYYYGFFGAGSSCRVQRATGSMHQGASDRNSEKKYCVVKGEGKYSFSTERRVNAR